LPEKQNQDHSRNEEMAAPISSLPIGTTPASSLAKGSQCSRRASREPENETRVPDNSASVPTIILGGIETSQHDPENPSQHSEGSPAGAFTRADSVVDAWKSPDGLNPEHLYSRGPPRLFQRGCSNGDKGGLCLELSYDFAQKMKEKVETGRHLRGLREAMAQRTEDLSNEESRIGKLQAEQQEKLRDLDAVLERDDREPTQDELLQARALSTDMDNACQVRADLQAEREYLPEYLQHFGDMWLDLVRQTEAMEADILTRSNLLPESEGKIQLPWKINPEKPNQPSVNPNYAQWPLSVPKTVKSCLKSAPARTPNHRELTRARIKMNERSTRHKCQAALEKHEDYRKGYGRMLEQYINQQANRPDADFQAEFSRHWLEGWRPLIRDLDKAEKAYFKATEEARAADVTIYDPEDDDDPTIAYDIDWWDQASIKQLDRGCIERWHAGVAAGVYGPEQPAGKDEAELERQAKAHGLGQFAADDLDVAAATAPKMPPGELSAIRVESTMAPPALCAPEETPTSIQKIKQILTDVQRVLSRASEPTSRQANGPGLVGQRAEGEAAMNDNQRKTKGSSNLVPNEILFGARGQGSLAEATRETSPLSSQIPTDVIAGDPAKVAKTSSKRKRAAVEEAVVVEPREKQHNEEMDWKWKMNLEEYMAKYNIEPPPTSKKRNQDYLLSNRDILITDSERAYGRKRRRIDEWGNKVRGGDC